MTEKSGSEAPRGFVQFSMREFLVDFLGGLVPGILFSITIAVVITLTFYPIIGRLKSPDNLLTIPQAVIKGLETTAGTPNMLWIGAFTVGIIVSYTLGHLFYRKDPKDPNRRSFERVVLSKSIQAELRRHLDVDHSLISQIPFGRYLDPRKWVGVGRHKTADAWVASKFSVDPEKIPIIVRWLRDNLGCACPEECEFPYPYLHSYLKRRNHKDLSDVIDWEEDAKKQGRSKTFINKLKIRMRYHDPVRHRILVRNEAHVRLATSTWYVGRTIRMATFGSLVLVGGFVVTELVWSPFALFGNWTPQMLTSWYAVPLALLLSVLAFAQFLQSSSEVFIHYQRLREVFFVLSLNQLMTSDIDVSSNAGA